MTVTIGTDSYGDEAGLTAYALARGVTISGNTTELLIKAMDVIEIKKYKENKYDREQDLEFPRTFYIYENGDENGVVPDKIIKCQYVTSLIIDAGGDPNANIARTVKKEKVDVIEKEYMDNSPSSTFYTEMESLLSEYLEGSGTSFKVYNG